MYWVFAIIILADYMISLARHDYLWGILSLLAVIAMMLNEKT